MKTVNRQDPAFREKVQDSERLSQLRLLLSQKVYKLLVETVKNEDYKLLSCSHLDLMDTNFNLPTREFRFIFSFDPEEKE